MNTLFFGIVCRRMYPFRESLVKMGDVGGGTGPFSLEYTLQIFERQLVNSSLSLIVECLILAIFVLYNPHFTTMDKEQDGKKEIKRDAKMEFIARRFPLAA